LVVEFSSKWYILKNRKRKMFRTEMENANAAIKRHCKEI